MRERNSRQWRLTTCRKLRDKNLADVTTLTLPVLEQLLRKVDMLKTMLMTVLVLALLAGCGEKTVNEENLDDGKVTPTDGNGDTGNDTDTDTTTEEAVVCAAPASDLGDVSLAEAFADHFEIGVALGSAVYDERDSKGMALVKRHFNRISPENTLKWEKVQPEEGAFRFNDADDFVGFGEANNLKIHGHVLVWHSQTPDWVFEGGDGGDLDRETLLARLEAHVTALAEQYGDRIDCWDVVNEAIDDNGNIKVGGNPWREIIGEDYIEQAFRIANELLPDSKLIYNDYSMWVPGRRNGAIKLVQDLRDKGLRIDGVGMQAHYNMTWPGRDDLRNALEAYRDAGIEVWITEMDIDVLPSRWDTQSADIANVQEGDDALNPYTVCLPEDVDQAAAERWGELFRVFVEYSDIINAVTLWAVTDRHSWLNDWPIDGRTNYPMLFNREYEPKTAVAEILKALE